MSNERSIIQLMHPGCEPSRGKKIKKTKFYLKEWNTGKHKRKYMCLKGDYLENGKLCKDKLIHFWGEWEPESICEATNHKGISPKSLYKPIFISEKMRKNGAIAHGVHFELEVSKKRQNTDPFVFGDTFYYTCCQRKRLFGPEKGDIILFGSCKNGKVLIDTVFVVDNPKLEVDDEFKKRNPIFYETVIIPMKNREGCGCADNAGTVNNVVTGAMYYKGDYPYSFIPFKKSDGKSYHERLEIRKQDYEKYFSGFKIRFNNQGIGYVKTDDKNDVNKFWHTLKEYCEKEGYCLGVHISLPTEVKSNTLDEFLK